MDIQPLGPKARLVLAHPSPSIEAYEGAVRSSKTITSLLDWVRFVRTGPAGALAMCGKTERTVINNLILPLQEMLGPSRVRINYGTGVVTICGREVHVYGANNEQARTKIQGATLAGAYADEDHGPQRLWCGGQGVEGGYDVGSGGGGGVFVDGVFEVEDH